jgi:hypothetical protein
MPYHYRRRRLCEPERKMTTPTGPDDKFRENISSLCHVLAQGGID